MKKWIVYWYLNNLKVVLKGIRVHNQRQEYINLLLCWDVWFQKDDMIDDASLI